MKIKHFSGYGSVTATKVKRSSRQGVITMVINVVGNHERGLEPYDDMDAIGWLLTKFDRKVENWLSINLQSCTKLDLGEYDHTNKIWVDRVEYTFVYTYKN